MTIAELIAAGVIQPTIDYAAGRMTGEDNQRALMGAVGSTAGMIGGSYLVDWLRSLSLAL